ncbi:MAG: hypothetical protein K2H16_01440 [Prevotella sp.]|nr:hypothetical protein [Prevotella sp.]
MIKKPLLKDAAIIKKAVIPESMLKFLSPAVIAHLEKEGAKENGTYNMAVGEWFIIERYWPGDYHKFATDGSRSELSVFRMAGGCNHLHTFDHPGAEKSEVYDSLSDKDILYLPDEFDDAAEIIEQKYIGKKLRVVARSAEGMDQYGHRYYLFAVE